MARTFTPEDVKKLSKEQGYIHVLCWDKERKKQIYDYVPKARLQEFIDSGYVLAMADR